MAYPQPRNRVDHDVNPAVSFAIGAGIGWAHSPYYSHEEHACMYILSAYFDI